MSANITIEQGGCVVKDVGDTLCLEFWNEAGAQGRIIVRSASRPEDNIFIKKLFVDSMIRYLVSHDLVERVRK